MQPPVEIRDRSEYKRRMNELLKIDPRRTVVLTVDMQNDYLDMKLGTAPVAPEEAKRVISHTRRLLAFARAEGFPVIHAYVKRRAVEPERGFVTSVLGEASRRARLSQNAQADVRKGPDRVDGTPQAELPSELVAPGDLHVTTKRVMDAFHGTDLDTLLGRVFKAESVIITGINTDTCVYATTFAAGNRGYQPVVISDCVASMRGLDHHWMALELMSRSIAWVMTVDEFKAKIQAAKVLEPVVLH
jgi:nicotinamidase-related amidase